MRDGHAGRGRCEEVRVRVHVADPSVVRVPETCVNKAGNNTKTRPWSPLRRQVNLCREFILVLVCGV